MNYNNDCALTNKGVLVIYTYHVHLVPLLPLSIHLCHIYVDCFKHHFRFLKSRVENERQVHLFPLGRYVNEHQAIITTNMFIESILSIYIHAGINMLVEINSDFSPTFFPQRNAYAYYLHIFYF